MRAALLVTLLVISAGCLGGADTNPKNDPRPTPDPTPPPGPVPEPTPVGPRIVLLSNFQFDDCTGIEAHVTADAAAAQALLPDNFTARADQGPAADKALARYRIFTCAQFGATNVAINETVYGDVSLFIDDPMIEESGEGNWYRFRIFATEDVLAEAWGIAGYDVLVGEVTMGATPLQQTLSFGGYAAQWIDTVQGGVLEEEVSFTETPMGVLVWGEVVDEARPVTQGLGSFSVPSDDPLRSLIGNDPTAITLYHHGQTDVLEAQLVLVRST